MSKDKLGTKRTCPNCEGKFFDLNKDPLTCPICKTEFMLEEIIKKRGESKISSQEIDNSADDVEIIINNGIDDTDIEDTSDLGDDNEDMNDVIQNLENDNDKEF